MSSTHKRVGILAGHFFGTLMTRRILVGHFSIENLVIFCTFHDSDFYVALYYREFSGFFVHFTIENLVVYYRELSTVLCRIKPDVILGRYAINLQDFSAMRKRNDKRIS